MGEVRTQSKRHALVLGPVAGESVETLGTGVSARASEISKPLRAGVLILLLLSGCTSHNEQVEADGATSRSGAVDPQVLNDVVATAFPAPGPSMRRMMRVTNFTADFVSVACGSTERLPLDRTVERYSQGEFPDLELIRTRGLVEEDPSLDQEGNFSPPRGLKPGCDATSKGNLFDKMPSFHDWRNLAVPWDDVVATVEQHPSVVALKAPFAQCLRDGTEGTGIVVSSEDPARTFLTQSDLAYVADKLSAHDREHLIPKLYARCGKAYFGRTQELLEAERPAMIERHRELLEQAARELVAMGYVP